MGLPASPPAFAVNAVTMADGSPWTDAGGPGYTGLTMRCERQDDRVTFHCPCIDGRVPGLMEISENLLTSDRVIVVDLAAVSLLRSAELSYLVELQRHAAGSGRSLQLTHIGRDIRKVLTITRLDRLFTIIDDE